MKIPEVVRRRLSDFLLTLGFAYCALIVGGIALLIVVLLIEQLQRIYIKHVPGVIPKTIPKNRAKFCQGKNEMQSKTHEGSATWGSILCFHFRR